MKKVFMVLAVALVLIGCKDTVKVNCIDCEISKTDDSTNYECGLCSVEAEYYEDFKIIQRPGRP